MTSYQPSPYAPFFPRRVTERQVTGIAVTVLLHVALLGCWQLARTPAPVAADGPRRLIQWIDLPALMPRVVPQPLPARSRPSHTERTRAVPPPVTTAPEPPAATRPEATVPLSAEPVPAPSAATIREQALRSAGAVDRALRKENRPYIVAPLDSPQIRMRYKMERAHATAAPELWEAPVVEELVNQTGDGARRERVITGRRTYCVTERSPATNVEMIERHGKIRITNCPQHEDIATQQAWRTARY